MRLTDDEKKAAEHLLAAGVRVVGAEIARAGFAAIEDGRAVTLFNVALTLRAALRDGAAPEAGGKKGE
jgi:hypothetical protein